MNFRNPCIKAKIESNLLGAHPRANVMAGAAKISVKPKNIFKIIMFAFLLEIS